MFRALCTVQPTDRSDVLDLFDRSMLNQESIEALNSFIEASPDACALVAHRHE
ncbi:hypothetical protein AB1399_02585 [Hydrogenibacillus schlegelii]|uniref:Uncharacterized protein n=1 Tax=Hydrogenibacillus schlegelii TaxID=1484 RepID=A0A2T5G9Q8_HYDSH|nr:hypothetical protein [Hydrogenibacillus schlegelii]MBT9283072.1 hypothetical protein [Hydrogenibacillus schlegelii]PTQ52916.1 MAG: hypothetical protein HSCHL_2415 [Hydrogenibacillus schlegelii]